MKNKNKEGGGRGGEIKLNACTRSLCMSKVDYTEEFENLQSTLIA